MFLFIVDHQNLQRKWNSRRLKVIKKCIMDGDYLFDCLRNIATSGGGGHECDECPASTIVGIFYGFSCKLVLEEVTENELWEEFWCWRANSCTSSIIILIIVSVGGENEPDSGVVLHKCKNHLALPRRYRRGRPKIAVKAPCVERPRANSEQPIRRDPLQHKQAKSKAEAAWSNIWED